jgi:acylphosphatase
VKGRVQGVGFRWFILRHAERLGLTGYCRNLPNGDVEVFAQGTDAALAELAGALRRGPAGARVDELEALNKVLEGHSFKAFNII